MATTKTEREEMSGAKRDQFRGWTTKHEIEFLDGVLACTNKFFNPKVGIKTTLQNYLSTMDNRRWDADIDVPAIRLHAQSLLAKCR